ncbi:UDP-diphosphatase, partial [Bacillus anthracis]|nr:UDP-diphosphatase [Bacillus anthracis]
EYMVYILGLVIIAFWSTRSKKIG